jgi:tripartite-type tricarboxylate transporter receptor subunit TctC
MKLPRRKFLHLAAGAAALPVISRIALAQSYPTRPVRLIVGFPAGGPADIVARLFGQWLSKRIGQQLIIENRVGAGGNIAAESVVKAAPDGYTLLHVTSTNAFNATLFEKLNFDLTRDIAPVASLLRNPGVMVVNPSFPAKSLPEFIAYAKANPGLVNMASGGPGSVPHIYGELFKAMAGVDLAPVHYRGVALAVPDLISGQVQVMFDLLPSSIAYIKAGQLRPLAVTSATRLDALPEISTVGEFVPGYEAGGWQGFAAPKNTSPEIISMLNKETNAILADPKTKARLAELSSLGFSNSPAEFGKHIADEIEKWGKVIRTANIKLGE